MTGAIASLHDFGGWASGNLLVIVMLVLGAILLTRLANWVRGLVIAQIEAREHESDELVRSEAAKHRQVVAQVVTWAVLAVMYVVAAVLVVERLGVPLAGLVAPAALLSAALGFGLQRFVQDIAAGLFITGERQYGFGDVVRLEVGRRVAVGHGHGRRGHPPGHPPPVGQWRGHHHAQRPDHPGHQLVA